MSTFFVYISTSFFYAFKFFNINICKHNICTVLCKFNRCCSPYSYGCSRNKYCLLIKIHIINLFHFIDITSYYLLSLLRLSKAVVQMLQERHIRVHINTYNSLILCLSVLIFYILRRRETKTEFSNSL